MTETGVPQQLLFVRIGDEARLDMNGRHLRLTEEGQGLGVGAAVFQAKATGQLVLDQFGQALAGV